MTIHQDFPPIGDYAIIGDCRSAALVSRAGAIEWLCWPRFDSDPIFGALLDREKGGTCCIAPADAAFQATRCYRPGTAILETTFRTSTGAVRVTDCMPVSTTAERRRTLLPDRQLLRIVEGIDGEVTLDIEYRPHPGFGGSAPQLFQRGALGTYCEYRGRIAVMRSDLPMSVHADASRCTGHTTLRAGERRYLSVAYSDRTEVVLPVLGGFADEQLRRTDAWWQAWSGRCKYAGQWRDAVVRSAITLKLLCFAPSGAVVAAPTTSLPEQIGGSRNWDYRYCWIRDASLTLQVLFDLGYADEAHAFISWLLYTTRITRPELQVMYDVYGGHRLAERELTELEGYAGSRPIRVGNGAHGQLQMDVYGEALDAIYAFDRRGGRLDRSSQAMLHDWARAAADGWNDADNGIWEVRGPARQHTYSLAMCWVALERYCQLIDGKQLGGREKADRYRDIQDKIRSCIQSRGYNATLKSYVSVMDGDEVDASLLMLARHGYIDPACDEMAGTFRLIEERLGRNGLLYRYLNADGLPGGEGTFGICSFWAATYLALAGRVDEAEARFDHVVGFANDVGLFSEEIDADSGAALGNFPQAFTHVGLIDAALTIEHCRGGKQRGTDPTGAEEAA